MGFEPTIRFPVYTLSRRAPSTTRPPLQLLSHDHADRQAIDKGVQAEIKTLHPLTPIEAGKGDRRRCKSCAFDRCGSAQPNAIAL